MGQKGNTLGFFLKLTKKKFINFSPSLNLSIDFGLMSHLIILTYLKWNTELNGTFIQLYS